MRSAPINYFSKASDADLIDYLWNFQVFTYVQGLGMTGAAVIAL
jgi:hypothetical protein